MPAYALSSLFTRARSLANMGPESGSLDFVTDTELLAAIKPLTAQLDTKLISAGYCITPATHTIAADGSDKYYLFNPSPEVYTPGPHAIYGVFLLPETTDVTKYKRLPQKMHSFNHYAQLRPTGSPESYTLTREVEGATAGTMILRLHPRPTTGTIVVAYHPDYSATLTAYSTVYYPAGVERWLVVSLAIDMLLKEESSTDDLRKELKLAEKAIADYVQGQQVFENARIRDIYSQDDEYDDEMRVWDRNYWVLF